MTDVVSFLSDKPETKVNFWILELISKDWLQSIIFQEISLPLILIIVIFFLSTESKNSSSFIGKICGGLTVEARDEKFLASLRREGKHICTAFLIAAKHAVTTAACLNDFLNKTEFADFNSYSLVVGRLDLAGGSAPLLIKSVQAHSRYIYDRPVAKYDVGLIKVNYRYILKLITHNTQHRKNYFPNTPSENCTSTVYFETSKRLISQLLLYSPLVAKIAIFSSQNR